MPPQKQVKEYKCQRCGQVYTSLMRLQHHQAAEHTAKILKDTPHSTGSS